MRLLTELCSVPTAPFVEDRVVAYVEAFVRQRRRLALSRDDFGNLLIELRPRVSKPNGSGAPPARWVFTAHMDHPGFIAREMTGPRTLSAAFRGGVKAEFFVGSKVRFFTPEGEVAGRVESVTVGAERGYPESAIVRVKGPVPAGAPGMWDLMPARVSGKSFKSRACDDLAGAAAALEMLDRLGRRPPESPVAVLLTRGEEEGFIGAIGASIRPKLLRKTDRVIAIETSSERPFAPRGGGAIIRVGDLTSVFNSGLSYFLTKQAEELAKQDAAFRFQRALMPGGTCEATVYDIYGFTAASICIALGNYHNMDHEGGRIAPEMIDLGDWESMVKLFERVARAGHTFEPGHRALKERVRKALRRAQAPSDAVTPRATCHSTSTSSPT